MSGLGRPIVWERGQHRQSRKNETQAAAAVPESRREGRYSVDVASHLCKS